MTNGQTMHTLPGSSQFPTTRWTLVVAAGDPHRKEARSALVSLCENYWYPLYAYLRRRGYPADQAQDLTQEFFMRVLEGRYQREPAHDETPERIFERRWALSVLDRAVEKLRNEFVHRGRPEHFERLKVFLLGQSDAPYAALAREMNTSEGALKVAIHRLRKRYRDLFRQEIADTVADPAEVESELRFLAAVLTGN
jgi:DNA-directed RNA polymerase specialized sigma24 family protein